MVLVMPWDLYESDSTWEEGSRKILTIKVQGKNYHVSVFKDASIGNSSLKETAHSVVIVTKSDDESTCENESPQTQRGAVESIRKCSPIINVEVKTKGGVNETVCVLVYNHIEIMNFKTSVAVTGQAFTIYAKVSENDQLNCVLRKADGAKLRQIFDVQYDGRAVQSVIAEVHHPRDSILDDETCGREAECKNLSPFHHGRINCKMKFFQTSSNKYHIVLLHLPGKPRRLILFDEREIELVTILKWGLKMLSMSEFKAAWLKTINSETGDMRARCVNSIKSMIEWMIAW